MTAPEPIVFILDDDASVLKSLKRLLQSAGWNAVTYESADDFLAGHDPAAHGCLILDMSMPGRDGLEVQRRLTERGSSLPVVFLTGHGDVPTSVTAMRAGAINFLSKPVKDDALLASVSEAVQIDGMVRRDKAEIVVARERLSTLTARERQVLERVVAGRLNKQIADELGTGVKTIKVHRARVMQKMESKSLAHLARLVERMGFLASH
jgi:FixJ family two-component response regulator